MITEEREARERFLAWRNCYTAGRFAHAVCGAALINAMRRTEEGAEEAHRAGRG